MLSISMADNVISYKKSKSLILLCTFGSRAHKWQKLPKNGSFNRDLLNFLYRYGIIWMPPGESSHPGGSEYVWQRGAEGVLGWVPGGRSWPYFQKKNRPKWAVKKNSYGHNFQSIASKLNQRGLIVYEPMLTQFGSDILKIGALSVFLDTAF